MLGYRSRRGLFIVELWFDESLPPSLRPDIIRYHQALNPPTSDCCKFYTLITDLTQENEVLMARMTKETRYEVRRAEEKDGLTLQVWDGKCPRFLSEFMAFYSDFADSEKVVTVE